MAASGFSIKLICQTCDQRRQFERRALRVGFRLDFPALFAVLDRAGDLPPHHGGGFAGDFGHGRYVKRPGVERAGKYWHAVGDGAIPLREIAEAIGSRLGLPAVSIPVDELMVPGYFGFLANIVTQSYPASNLATRRTLG